MQGVVPGYDPSVFAAYTKRQKPSPSAIKRFTTSSMAWSWGSRPLWCAIRPGVPRKHRCVGGAASSLVAGLSRAHSDGNAPAATEHRLGAVARHLGGTVARQDPVVMDPELSLACDAFLTPDGHAQERSLLDDVLQTVRARDLWMADRNSAR